MIVCVNEILIISHGGVPSLSSNTIYSGNEVNIEYNMASSVILKFNAAWGSRHTA